MAGRLRRGVPGDLGRASAGLSVRYQIRAQQLAGPLPAGGPAAGVVDGVVTKRAETDEQRRRVTTYAFDLVLSASADPVTVAASLRSTIDGRITRESCGGRPLALAVVAPAGRRRRPADAPAAVARWAAGLPGGRRQQAEVWIAARPVPTTTPARVCQWAYNLHAAVARRLGRPVPTYARAAAWWGYPPSPVVRPDRVVCLSLASRNDRWAAFTASCRRSAYLSEWGVERGPGPRSRPS